MQMTRLSFALVLASIPTALAFWRLPCANPLTVERLDPIINPGQVSSHVHTVMGGSGFAMNISFEQMRDSECTSCYVKQDLSAYWVPQLYLEFANGTFLNVPQNGGASPAPDARYETTVVYYLQRNDPSTEKIYAFPDGFRMVSGNPSLRSYNASSLEQQAINYVCLTYTDANLTSYNGPVLPAQNCPDGLRAQVAFPRDGINVDSSDHKSHVAFPSGVTTGKCPASHPVRLITLFYEVTFNVDNFDAYRPLAKNASQPFVWAMGDPIGTGYHGDFINGWDHDVLQAAVDQCTDASGVIEKCGVFDLQDQGYQCHKTPTVNETVTGSLLPKLPGCNPVTSGPQSASLCTDPDPPLLFSDPVAYNVSIPPIGAELLPGAAQTVLQANGYNYTGCVQEVSGRLLPNGLSVSGDMTVEKCLAACAAKSYDYCALEYAQECYGAHSVEPTYLSYDHCDKVCKGNDSEYCGGSNALSLYQAISISSFTTYNSGALGYTLYGFWTEGSGVRTLSAASYASSNNMTVANCIGYCSSRSYTFAGVEYGDECYCGNSTAASASALSSISNPMACSGNASEWCGGGNKLVIYQASPEHASISGYAYTGCLSDVTSSRALIKGISVTGNMTVEKCLASGRAKGYMYCGLEYGQECWCSGYITSGNSLINATLCSKPCKGDVTETCGGSSALSFYTATNLTGITQTVNGTSSPSSDFVGCYSEATSGRALSKASTTSNSATTVKQCVSYCASKNTTYAGLEYGGECYCGNTFGTGAALVSESDPISAGCNMACTGDVSQYCGGSARLSVYAITNVTL